MKPSTNNDTSRQRFSELVASLRGAIQVSKELRFEKTEQTHPGDDTKNGKKPVNWLIYFIRRCCIRCKSLHRTKQRVLWSITMTTCHQILSIHVTWTLKIPVLPAHPQAPCFSETGALQAVQPAILGTNGPFPSKQPWLNCNKWKLLLGLYSRALAELYQRNNISPGTQWPLC